MAFATANLDVLYRDCGLGFSCVFSVRLKMHGGIYLFTCSCCMENKAALKNPSVAIALFLVDVCFIEQICRADSVCCEVFCCLGCALL